MVGLHRLHGGAAGALEALTTDGPQVLTVLQEAIASRLLASSALPPWLVRLANDRAAPSLYAYTETCSRSAHVRPKDGDRVFRYTEIS